MTTATMTTGSDANSPLDTLSPEDRLRALIGLWPALNPEVAPPAGVKAPYALALVAGDQGYTVQVTDDGKLSVAVGAPEEPDASVQGQASSLWERLGERGAGHDLDGDARALAWLTDLGGEAPAQTLADELAARGPAIGRECLGRTFPGKAEELTVADLVAFAEATSDDNPRFIDTSRPGGIIAAPTFPVRFFNPLFFAVFADPLVKMDFSRLLFGEMSLTLHGALKPGETVLPEAETLSLEDKDTGQLLRVGVRLRVGDELRTEGVANFFVRWKKRTRIQRLKLPAKPLVLGDERFSASLPIHEEQPKLFSVAGRDPNPLHLDDAFAKRAGLPGVILQGLCTMAICGRAVLAELTDNDPSRLKGLKVRFSRPARPGQVLTTRAFAPQEEEGAKRYPFIATNDVGDEVITGGEATLTD